ncbi:MAG: hypothetical protein OEQ18_04130 [Gammaproteobacteria bacterium]|nr:hypothetical protein [Gammaproteobacteria bacterium]
MNWIETIAEEKAKSSLHYRHDVEVHQVCAQFLLRVCQLIVFLSVLSDRDVKRHNLLFFLAPSKRYSRPGQIPPVLPN